MDAVLEKSHRTVKQMTAKYVIARNQPLMFADMIIAAQGTPVLSHPMFRLFSKLFLACFRQHRGLLIQAPPEHGKTSFIIPTLMWLIGKSPKMKIGIVCKDSDLSTEHLTRVRKGMLSTTFQSVFPDIIPDYKRSASEAKGEWSKQKLYIKGETEPAFERYSLYGAAEGHRLDLIWADDCVTRDCLYSEAARRNTASALFETFANRLTNRGMLLVTNNCWHRDDAIHQMKVSKSFTTLWIGYHDTDAMYWEIINPPPSWKGETEGAFDLWEQWSHERLVEKQNSPGTSWKRLFRGVAITPDDSRFIESSLWKRYDKIDFKDSRLYGYLDPSGGRSLKQGDFAATLAVLMSKDKIFDVIDCVVERASVSTQLNSVFSMHEKWARTEGCDGFFRFGVEMLAKDQEWIKQPFNDRRIELRESGSDFWQVPLRISNPRENKESRIERLGPMLENGWLRFPLDLEDRMREDTPSGRSWRRLVFQMEEWPFSDHDDGPDSLAGAIAMTGPRQRARIAGVITI